MKTVILISFDYGQGKVWRVAFRPNCDLGLQVGDHFADLAPVMAPSVPEEFNVSDVSAFLTECDPNLDHPYHLLVEKVSKICNAGDPVKIVQSSVNLHKQHNEVMMGDVTFEEAILWSVVILALQFGARAHINMGGYAPLPKWFRPKHGWSACLNPVMSTLI